MGRAKTVAKTRIQSGKRPNPKARAGTAGFLTRKNLNIVLCVLLAAATLALYSPVIDYQFLQWDDDLYVTANLPIRGGLDWSTIKWAFTSTETAGYWLPVTWLSHALDIQLFALNPAGHHLDNAIIHALNAASLFLLLVWVTRRVGPSLLVAALFAVHPLNVESVAWVAERKNVLSTLFFILSIVAYAWYTRKPDWRRYLLVAFLFAAGLMAKPMVVTLPFVLLLLDYWPLGRMLPEEGECTSAATATAHVTFMKLLLEKIPLLGLSAASACITIVTQGPAEQILRKLPLSLRIENALVSCGLYLWKTVWPAHLAAFYPHPLNTLPIWQVILSGIVLLVISALVIVFRRRRYLPVGWFWFLGTLIPVIGVVQSGEQAMADRFAYIPLVGIFIMIAWSLDDWAQEKSLTMAWRVVPALCVLVILGFVTSRQMSFWKNGYAMWTHTVEVNERNAVAHEGLATALLYPPLAMTRHDLESFASDQERLDAARRNYERALELRREMLQQNPDLRSMAQVLGNLGILDGIQNRLDDARQHLQGALGIYRQLAQEDSTGHLHVVATIASTLDNLGNVDSFQNRLDDARRHEEEALQIYRGLAQQDPDRFLADLARTLSKVGNLAKLQNRAGEACDRYEEALSTYRQLMPQDPHTYQPQMVEILMNLGFLERSRKQTEKAYSHFQEALEIDRQLAQQDPEKYLPEEVSKALNLGNFAMEQNRMEDARPAYVEAVKNYRLLAQQNPGAYLPDLAGTLTNLGILDGLQKRVEESRADYTEAMNIYRKLAQGDPARYAGDVIRVEASLRELDNKDPLPVRKPK
jgi:tetratricopeptide (TPR) repeat protein